MKRKRLPINQIIQGDCLEVMKELPDKSIDMILCDLPYGTTACEWDTIIPFEPLWEQYKRLIKDNGAIVLTTSQPFTSMLVMSNPKWFKYEWIWDKKSPRGYLNAKKMPLKRHESVVVFGYGNISYFPQMRKGKARWKGGKSDTNRGCYGKHDPVQTYNDEYYPTTILEMSGANQRIKEHPTQKPVPLCEYLIKTYTRPGEVVLDNCIGSGTTAIACINIGRNFIGIEKEEKYVRIAQKRIEACKKQNQMRLFPLSKLEKTSKRYKGLFE